MLMFNILLLRGKAFERFPHIVGTSEWVSVAQAGLLSWALSCASEGCPFDCPTGGNH